MGQLSSGDTNRSGCSGESGGEVRMLLEDIRRWCSISSSDSINELIEVLIESKLRLLEIWLCTIRSSFAVFPREFRRVLCSTIAESMGEAGTVDGIETGPSLISSRSNEKDLSIYEGAPGPPNRTMDPRRTLVGTTTLLLFGVEVTRTPLM